MSTSQYSETRPLVHQLNLDSSAGTNYGGLMDWGGDPYRIDAVVATSTEAIDHVLTIVIESNLDIPVGSVNIPAGAGHGAVPAVDVLGALPSILRNGWAMTSAESVKATLEVACVAGMISLVALGGVI